jgi:hypothetical protein
LATARTVWQPDLMKGSLSRREKLSQDANAEPGSARIVASYSHESALRAS